MSLGLPELNIAFKSKGVTAVTRSARGIVTCILKDDTEGGDVINIYRSILDVDFTIFTEANYGFLKLVYEGGPSKVIVAKIPTTATYNDVLKTLKNLKWNYLVIPGIEAADITTVSAWIKEMRDQNKKTVKAVLPNCAADHEGIINFTTDKIESTITERVHTTAEYCARIAGIMAGLSLTRSSTYFVLTDIISAKLSDEPNEDINKGELIIVYDGEKYKIGRGVNSLVTFTTEKTKDVRKIKIVEGMDLYADDIRGTYDEHYVGKVINDYDNKQALVAAIGAYHRELQGDVLDRSFDNTVSVNLTAQKDYLESQGTDTSEMDDIQLAIANTGSHVFLASNIKFVDAMEDLGMEVNM